MSSPYREATARLLVASGAELHSATAHAVKIAIKSNDAGSILQANHILRAMTEELIKLSNLGRPRPAAPRRARWPGHLASPCGPWPAYERSHPGTPGPCHTCAFNPSADTWRGFEKTAFSLMKAIRKGEPFHCHEGLARSPTGQWYYDPALPPPARCRGWEAIAAEPDTATAAFVVARKIGPPPTRSKARPR